MPAFDFLALPVLKLVVSSHSVCSNAQKLGIFPTWRMYVFYMILTTNSDCYPNNINMFTVTKSYKKIQSLSC